MGNFIVLSGTPAVGTRHLYNALTQLHPDIARNVEKVVLYTSRPPRPREQDGREFHFRNTQAFYGMAGEASRYLCFQVDRDKYALDLDEVKRAVALEGKTGFLEIHPTVFSRLRRRPELESVNLTTVFLSPVSRNEIELMLKGGGLKNVSKQIENLTAGKLIFGTLLAIRRGEIKEEAPQDITAQAQGAFNELKLAADYQWVLPNHCGDGDPHWGVGSQDPVFGDAAQTLASFAAIVRGEMPPYAESWKRLFPG